MITLLVLACLAGDDCRVVPIAGGFVHERQCEGYRSLMIAGWAAQHPEARIERSICTDKPAYIIARWMT